MVAYSFQKRFEGPIMVGLQPGPPAAGAKRHTIRGDRNRHARPGERIQLYVGMRTRHCRLLGAPVCTATHRIELHLGAPAAVMVRSCFDGAVQTYQSRQELDAFALADGFSDWRELEAFWGKHHPDVTLFRGVLVEWKPED